MLLIGRKVLSKGFTFLELLIVIIILGVIMGFSIPRFQGAFNNLQLKMAAHDLSQFFRYAQGEAARDERIHKIVVDNHSYWLMVEKEDEDNEFERTSGRWGKTNIINKNIEVAAENDEIFFYPEGWIDRVEIGLKRGDASYTLTTKERQGYVELLAR
ncbi:MAG: prepilin-type N-terminal cleavage/methylation domain-containing protein [Candidatus Omnitrophica bacterium]|nr:prepilin-type N-terminal cleavage/methylation domain-containing protein [Candidatus Omnitrophota bacterium]